MSSKVDMQECKVFFDLDVTKEQAQRVIDKYTKSTIDTYQVRRSVGCNEVTYAVVTLPVAIASRLIDDSAIKRIDVLVNFKAVNSGAEDCSGGSCGSCGCTT